MGDQRTGQFSYRPTQQELLERLTTQVTQLELQSMHWIISNLLHLKPQYVSNNGTLSGSVWLANARRARYSALFALQPRQKLDKCKITLHR